MLKKQEIKNSKVFVQCKVKKCHHILIDPDKTIPYDTLIQLKMISLSNTSNVKKISNITIFTSDFGALHSKKLIL